MNADFFWLILLAGVITYSSRLLPFVLLRNPDQPLLQQAGKQMPAMIVTLLVMYSLKDFQWQPAYWWTLNGVPLIGCALLAFGLHLWKRNALLSIFSATAVYLAFSLIL